MKHKEEDVKIEAIFQAKRKDGSAIGITTHKTERDDFGVENLVMDWILVKHIEDSSFDSIHDLHRGERITIFIPEWVAIAKGLV